MKGNFRSMIKRYCLQSTVVGLKYFYIYPDRISRCFWALNMFLVFSFACTMALQLYQRFDKMPTRITIENQYEPVENMPYPAITICSPNQITISSVRHFNKTLVNGKATSRVNELLPLLLGFYQPPVELIKEDLELLQELIDSNRYTIPEVISLLAQSCDQFLRFCYFQDQEYDGCKNLFHPILTAHGLCCTFNSIYHLQDGKRNVQRTDHKVHLVKRWGKRSSLTVVADSQPHDALDGTLANGGAIRVMFTDWLEFPADDVTTLVLSNSESFHSLFATYTYCSQEVKNLPVNSRKCYLHDEKRLRHFGRYHNSDCDHLCTASNVEATCNCIPSYLPQVPAHRLCTLTALPCYIDVNKHMDIWVGSEQCDCLRDCESRVYSVDMMPGNLRARKYALSDIYTKHSLNTSSAVMHFFFAKSVFVKKKQETVISLISLVSNLGGVFGLCMGCSAISVVELVFYLYSALKSRNYCHRISNRVNFTQ